MPRSAGSKTFHLPVVRQAFHFLRFFNSSISLINLAIFASASFSFLPFSMASNSRFLMRVIFLLIPKVPIISPCTLLSGILVVFTQFTRLDQVRAEAGEPWAGAAPARLRPAVRDAGSAGHGPAGAEGARRPAVFIGGHIFAGAADVVADLVPGPVIAAAGQSEFVSSSAITR